VNDLDTAAAEGTRRLQGGLRTTRSALSGGALEAPENGLRWIARDVRTGRRDGPVRASLAHLGVADLEMFRGAPRPRPSNCSSTSPATRTSATAACLGAQYAVLAQAYLPRDRSPRHLGRPESGRNEQHESVGVLAALALVESGREVEAEGIARALEKTLQRTTIAYSRLIRASIASHAGRYADAIDQFRESIKQRDTWLARFFLGRLYADLEHYPEAMAELDLCMKRRGEAADLFFYDTPTPLSPASVLLAGSHQQALGASGARTSRAVHRHSRAGRPPDPLLADARARLGQ